MRRFTSRAAARTVMTAVAAALVWPAVTRAHEGLEIEPHRLDNGLEVVVVEKHDVPIVTIEVAVKTGAFTEDRETNGLSHLYEHMFFKGNARIPTQEAYMKRMAELGIHFNGTTGNERVNYFITLPSKNFSAGMRFMADALLTPLFNQEELEKERKVVIGEYDRNESNPSFFLHEAVGKAAYGEDYLRKNPLGVRETILRASRETMIKFKETYYVPNNSLLSIVGDVNPTEAETLVEKFFGPREWKMSDDPHAKGRAPLPRLEQSKGVVVGRERATPTLSALWNGPDTDRDVTATFAADVWGTMCALPFGRFQKALKDSGLCASASLSYFTQRSGGEAHFNALLRKSPQEVRDALFAQIEAMAEDPAYFTDEDLAQAKQQLAFDRAYEAQSGESLSHNLTFWWASASFSYYQNYLNETGRVTLEDVRKFVRNYLAGRPCVLGYLDSKDELEKTKLDEASLLGTPPERKGGGVAAAVQTVTLSNGVKAIIRQDPGAPIGALEVFLNGGAAFLTPETAGVERFALATALEGPASMERDAWKKALSSTGSRLSLETFQDFSHVGIQAPADHFMESLSLMAECLREPAFRKQDVEQKRGEILIGLKKEQENPDSKLRRMGSELLYAGHPYASRPDGTPENVKRFAEDDLRAAIKRATTPGRVLLVLVSSLPHEGAKGLLEEKFGWIAGSKDAPPSVPPIAGKDRSAFEERQTPTTYVRGMMVLPTPAEKDWPAAKVLMQVLHRRLWESIRTKHALSYAPAAGAAASRANFGIVYATSSNPKKTLEVMFEDLRKLKDELVPADELAGIVSEDATTRAVRSEGSASHALALGTAELLSGGWRRHYEENEDLAKVTPEQVREVARRCLKDLRWAVIGKEQLPDALLADPIESKSR